MLIDIMLSCACSEHFGKPCWIQEILGMGMYSHPHTLTDIQRERERERQRERELHF